MRFILQLAVCLTVLTAVMQPLAEAKTRCRHKTVGTTPTQAATGQAPTTTSAKTTAAAGATLAPTSNTPATGGSGKRGLAVPWDSVGSDIDAVAANGKITWMYNWETYAPPGGKQFEFVAMLRTGSADDLSRFKTNMPTSKAKYLSCINEPDIADQANMSVDQAVKIWKEVCWPQKVALGLKIGAPAISNGASGLPWLQEFISKVQASNPPDFYPIHWYGSSSADFQSHVEKVHTAINKPIWVTEFASQQTSTADQKTFLTAAMKFLDGAAYVERYSWFAYSRTAKINDASRLLSASGAKTDLMTLYSS